MKKLLEERKFFIPKYAVIPLLFCLLINGIVYFGIGNIAHNWKHYDLTLPIDRKIPLIPEFICIYLGCYLFWIINYIIIVRQGKEHCMRFVTADIMARLLCGIIYLILPTTNIRPSLSGDGIFIRMLQILYEIDAPTKLFPSIHCLVSWFCYIGIRGQKNISKIYQIFSCIAAVLVFISTQVIKQHGVADIFASVLIAELTYYIAFHRKYYQRAERVFDRLTKFLLKEKEC